MCKMANHSSRRLMAVDASKIQADLINELPEAIERPLAGREERSDEDD